MDFTNPYLATPEKERSRTTLLIPYAKVSQVKKYESKDGSIQTTVCILLEKFLESYERTNPEIGDFSAFHAAVCGAVITLPGQQSSGATESGGTIVKPTARSKRARTIKTAA